MLFDLRSLRTSASICALALVSLQATAAPVIMKDGAEHRLMFELPGAQINPHLSLNSDGGYLVAQDSTIDGSGQGIRGRKFQADLSGSRASFVANSSTKSDQGNARVAVFNGGGAVFIWLKPGTAGAQTVARFMLPNGTFNGPEINVSDTEGFAHVDPALSIQSDNSVVIAWTSNGQDGHMQGVYARRFSSTGQKLGAEFRVNQATLFNQRSPAVVALNNGNFVIAWVSEQQRNDNSFDIYARTYNSVGTPLRGEFRASSEDNVCANPVGASLDNRGFALAWTERKFRSDANGWDIRVRTFNLEGVPQLNDLTANQNVRGDQFVPQIATLKGKVFLVWTSMGQDGYDDGVFGRVMDYSGAFDTDEFRVNTTTISKQIHPTIASNGKDTFVVAWAGFTGLAKSYDIFGQRFHLDATPELPTPEPPFLSALSQTEISVSWPDFLGSNVDHYELFLDGTTTPTVPTDILHVFENAQWQPGSTHSVRIGYVLKDGRRSPVSEAALVKTWAVDSNKDGLPDDWQNQYWGIPGNWSRIDADPDEDGATNLQEYLAGTNPIDPTSVLETRLATLEQGLYIEWNTTPGSVYQVQVTTDFKTWFNYGQSRFATSTSDLVPAAGPGSYYRVIRLR